jgi:hypothetical protein
MSKRDGAAGGAPTRSRDAYVELEARLAELLVRARAGQWPGLEGDWADFMTAVAARCAYEEELLFPAYGAHDADRRALVKQLVEEHAAMHQLLAEIGRQIHRRSVRETTVELVTEVLRDHAAIESANIDPWIDLDPRKWSLGLGRVPS